MMLRFVSALAFVVLGCGGKTENELPSNVDGGTDSAVDSATIDYAACGGPGECVLSMNGCCGSCGEPTLASFTAVNEQHLAAFRKQTCPDPDNTTCPGCATTIEKSLMAFCEGGTCKGIDLRTHPFSACTSNDECVLRTSECCECGGDSANPIAINRASASAYANEVCKPGTGCPECAAVYPPELKAVCDNTTKHCTVLRPF